MKTENSSVISQEPPVEELQPIIQLYTEGELHKALFQTNQMLERLTNSAALLDLAAACNLGLTQFKAAINNYEQLLKITPNNSEAHNNLGYCLYKIGILESAIDSYKQAVLIKPDFAQAYYNLGLTYFDAGKIEAAIDSYKKALLIKPDYAEAYNNIGTVLRDRGEYDEALEYYNKLLLIQPNSADAYYNIGVTMLDKGELDKSLVSLKYALEIKPDFAEVAFNLSALTTTTSESIAWVEYCLKVNPSHLDAKLMLSALKFYEGDKSNFNELKQSHIKDHPFMRSFAWVFGLTKLPRLHFHRWALFDHVLEKSKINRPFYEFGVWRGESFRYLLKTFKKGYGFDTFTGLPENWHSVKEGNYSNNGNIPEINGGEFIVGKFNDTLPIFFSEHRPMASVINFDADLYSSTICALNCSKPIIDKHTILIFDEFLMNENWEQDEYKALNEFCLQNNYSYEVLEVSFITKQVAMRLISI